MNNIAYCIKFWHSVLLEKNYHEIMDNIVSLLKIFLSRTTELYFQLLILYKCCKICNICLNHLRLVENSHVHMYMLKMLVNKFKIWSLYQITLKIWPLTLFDDLCCRDWEMSDYICKVLFFLLIYRIKLLVYKNLDFVKGFNSYM